jgi:hypothetical protein
MENQIIRNRGTSAALVVLVLAVFVLLNVFTGILTERFYLKLDMTEAGLFTIDSEAVAYLESMREPVDVIVLQEESVWLARPDFMRVVELLRQYSRVSGGKFRVQYVNPDHNIFDGPEYGNSLTRLGEAHTNLQEMKRDDILFLSSRRADIKAVDDLFAVMPAADGNPQWHLNADAELMAALFYVLSEEVATAVFLQGHNEAEAGFLRGFFERSGYDCFDIDLRREPLPDSTLIVISVGPKQDFMPMEIEQLEAYLSDGGCLMVFYDFETASLTNLDAFLNNWGLAVEHTLLQDSTHSLSGIPGFVYAEIKSTDGFFPPIDLADGWQVGTYLARPIRWMFETDSRNNLTAKPLISSDPSTSFAIDLNDGNAWAGPFDLAYLVRREGRAQSAPGSLIVSNAGMIEDWVLDAHVVNQALMYTIMDTFNPFGESVFIPPKNLWSETMPVTSGQSRIILILLVVIVPLGIMVAGILVYRRRRHK